MEIPSKSRVKFQAHGIDFKSGELDHHTPKAISELRPSFKINVATFLIEWKFRKEAFAGVRKAEIYHI